MYHKREGVKEMLLLNIKPLWPEDERFFLERRITPNEYIFIHTVTPLKVKLCGKFEIMPPDSVICFAPRTYQCIEAVSGGLIHDWMHLSPDFLKVAQKYSFETGKIYPLNDGSFVTRLMQETELEKLKDGRFSKDICELKLHELIAKIMRCQGGEENTPEVSPAVYSAFIEVRRKIHMEYSDRWDIEKMANLVHLSPSRFFSVYKKIFGISPKNDLLNVRMEHAKTILFDGSISIKEAAEMTGYTNFYHFIRAFKNHTGMTPGKYRKTENI